MNTTCEPVILIGAARSGTKLLRDVIARHPDIDKVPYDVNYIWRQGNESLPHDELMPVMLTPTIRDGIRQELSSSCAGGSYLIEKTVSNCLRVEYVDAVFPTARFIYLVRNGIDVVESVYRQWTAPPDWRYILKKSRTFPLRKAPGYAINYAGGLLTRLVTKDAKKVGTWGPRYVGIEKDLKNRSLLEVSALQWAACMHKADAALSRMDPARVHTVRYEEFVQSPRDHLAVIADWLGIEQAPFAQCNLHDISASNIGKGRTRLDAEQLDLIMPILEPLLVEQHYV